MNIFLRTAAIQLENVAEICPWTLSISGDPRPQQDQDHTCQEQDQYQDLSCRWSRPVYQRPKTKTSMFVCLLFNDTFSTNRLYRAIGV